MRALPTTQPGRPRPAPRARALAVLLAFAAGGCGGDGPTGVPGATAYRALAAYPFWWSLVEACSGLRGDVAAVRWARVPGRSIPGRADDVQGQWDPATNTVTVVAGDTAAGPLVRHEMLHALLGAGVSDHPPAYFGARCAGYVACEGACATQVAAATPPSPADAPTLAPDRLAVTARVVAPAGGAGAAGGAFAILVTAQSPVGMSGWVARAASPSAPEAPEFGYALTTPLFPGVPLVTVSAAPGARTYFGAGELKQYIFDASAGDLPRGPYQLQGLYAGALSAATPVTLPP